jgi:ribonucleotide reductase alpha subunit
MAVLRDKYLQPGEAAAADVLARVARALASVEPAQHRAGWERRFHRHLLAGGIGAGPDHAQSSSQDAADNSTQSATLDATHNATHHATPGMFQRTDGLWVYASLPARALWDALMRAAFDVGEPSVLFIDRIRQDNNLRALETLDATNPCGEQPLPAYGACALGPLILPRFVRHPFGQGGAAQLDFAALTRHARLQVRLLDNVLELTRWPLPQQAQEARLKRRIGVGFTGLGDALVMLGLRYDSEPSGIEPAFAWTCTRERRGRDGRANVYIVEDHAWRVYRALGGRSSPLPPAFVSATEVQPQDHLAMMQAVQPFVDASISKTVNLAPELPYERFQDLYLQAWRAGLKGLAAYRPSAFRPGLLHAGSVAAGALTSGLPAPHFPGLAVSCGLSHAVPHERPTPRKEAQDVHQGAAGL